jgi:hypothetical protein
MHSGSCYPVGIIVREKKNKIRKGGVQIFDKSGAVIA